MSTRVITPPSMDINRDMSQNCPDSSSQPSVVALPSDTGESGGGCASLPESAGGCVPMTTSSLGCPSPAISPNSSSSMLMGPTTELILSTRIRSVPRCLFGPPDPLTAQFAKEQVKKMRDDDKKRYNFDFDAEEPMEGKFKWEPLPVAPPSTTTGSTGSSYAPKAYALSRFPYLSGSMVQVDRGMVSPPPLRTNINNNQLPPMRELYFDLDREPLFIARTVEEDRHHRSSRARSPSSVSSTIQSSASLSSSSTITSSTTHSRVSTVVDPTLLLPSPEASSCSSEDSANVLDMEMGEEEEEEDALNSVDSSSTEDDLKISNVLQSQEPVNRNSTAKSTTATNIAITNATLASSSSSGLSSRACSSSSTSSCSSPNPRRTKSVSSSSSSPTASPSSPSSSQPPITRFMPVRKRSASTPTAKAASESAPTSSAATTEKKRAC